MKETLNLPRTDFPMKGDLARREPEFISFWEDKACYEQLIHSREGAPRFVINDGPPYANGPIHIGHAVNKILKDFILKSKNLEGYQTPYIPGWDCHGLPIEVQVERTLGRNMPAATFRQHCRDYATQQIAIQEKGFKRLGVQADWKNRYATMDSKFEANIVRQFQAMLDKNLIKSGLKPVHWCPHCQSSLSEAETEFAPKQSHSVDVRFEFIEPSMIEGKQLKTSVVIWTTTPWTLPANQAVAFGPFLQYVAIIRADHAYLVAHELVEASLARWGWNINDVKIVPISTEEWTHRLLKHPFYDRLVPLLPGNHVTLDAGTGFVHTAPAHGPEDYELGHAFGLKPLELFDGRGRFIDSVPQLGSLVNFEAELIIIDLLKETHCLLSHHKIEHNYLVCWRHKKPIFYRATPQWFVSLSPEFKKTIIESIDTVTWYPAWGSERMRSMIENRPDSWCISRQRNWGTPLVLIYDQHTYAIHPQMTQIIDRVAQAIEERGLEAWFGSTPQDWGVVGEQWVASRDTLDVWFDSGSVFHILMKKNQAFPADLYLEGVDQYRGWFQSSLICSVGRMDCPPYKSVLTHGFTVDQHGKKMSKSLGNVISPFDVADKFGIDVLRLWVATSNYREEMAIGDEILTRASDSYRRLRNTLRFLLSNLYDFNLENLLPFDQMAMLDRYFLYRIAILQRETRLAYEQYNFDHVARSLIDFCVNELGSDYLDIVKDRLYTAYASSQARRSSQTTLYYILVSLIHQLAPLLPFTAEDAWQHFHLKTSKSILLNQWPVLDHLLEGCDEINLACCQNVLAIKKKIQPQLELLRQQGTIGSALEAKVILTIPTDHWLKHWVDELKFIFLVSEVEVRSDLEIKEPMFSVEALVSAEKCERCWHRVPVLKDACCPRCLININQPGEMRTYG